MQVEYVQFSRNKEKLLKALSVASNTNYYRNLFLQSGLSIDEIKTYDDFKKIPITNKTDYLNNKYGLIRQELLGKDQIQCLNRGINNYTEIDEILKPSSLSILITSGSTGVPLEVIRSNADLFNNYKQLNLFRKNVKGFKSISNHVWVLPESLISRKYVFNESQSVFRYSKYGYIACIDCLNKDTLKEFTQFCIMNKINALISWPTFLERLCDYTCEFPKSSNIFKTINYFEVNSEYLSEWQREKIEKVIDTTVLNVYSGNESNFIGVSVHKDIFYLLDSNVFLELIPNKDGVFETIITNLCSPDSSLIRYNLGDLAEWLDPNPKHQYFREYPFSFKLLGCRTNDHLLTKNNEEFEFNVINDLIHFIQNKQQIYFGKYKMIQIAYDKFQFQFSNEITSNILRETKCYFEGNLKKILGYEVYVRFERVYNLDNLPFKEKYRCFECRIKI